MELHRVPAEWMGSDSWELLDKLAELEWHREADEITSVGLDEMLNALAPLVAGEADDQAGPQALAIDGGALLGDMNDMPAVLVLDPGEVRRVSEFLASVSFEDLLHRNRAAVDASVHYDWTDTVEDLRGYFSEVTRLYADAAAAGEAVVKVIS